MIRFLMYLWQLPQNLIGLAFIKILKASKCVIRINKETITYYQTDKYSFGVTFGKYIVIGNKYAVSARTILHEYGHTVQSKILGPLYLIVIGLPSVINNIFNGKKESYYDFYTEAWADKISGVIR